MSPAEGLDGEPAPTVESPGLEMVLQAHNALHRDLPAEAHVMLHRALGIPDDTDIDLRPDMADYQAFDKAFRELCITHNCDAAYTLRYDDRLYQGGSAEICRYLQHMNNRGQQAGNRAQRRRNRS